MRRLGFSTASGLALFLTLAAVAPMAHASSCSMLSYSMDEARSKLKRAANETDFESAKDYARRARSALDDAAMAAMDCGCIMVYSELDTAASRARRARDADDANEYVDSLNRSIRSFNSALEALRSCSRKK